MIKMWLSPDDLKAFKQERFLPIFRNPLTNEIVYKVGKQVTIDGIDYVVKGIYSDTNVEGYIILLKPV